MTGRQTAGFMAAWGVGLLVLGALGPILGSSDTVALSELPAAAVATFVLAAIAFTMRDRDVRDLPDASVGATALGIGLTLAGAAAAVGLWLLFLAAPIVLLGVYAWILERRP